MFRSVTKATIVNILNLKLLFLFYFYQSKNNIYEKNKCLNIPFANNILYHIIWTGPECGCTN